MTGDWTFHHLGLACSDLDAERLHWQGLGYRQEGEAFEDPNQRVRGLFMTGPGPRLELLVPTTEDSPVRAYLRSGAKIYHQCFLVGDLPATLEAMRAKRCKVVVEPVAAVAFGGRRIAFVLTDKMHLLEFAEEA